MPKCVHLVQGQKLPSDQNHWLMPLFSAMNWYFCEQLFPGTMHFSIFFQLCSVHRHRHNWAALCLKVETQLRDVNSMSRTSTMVFTSLLTVTRCDTRLVSCGVAEHVHLGQGPKLSSPFDCAVIGICYWSPAMRGYCQVAVPWDQVLLHIFFSCVLSKDRDVSGMIRTSTIATTLGSESICNIYLYRYVN